MDQLLDRSAVEEQDAAGDGTDADGEGGGGGSASNALGSLLQTFKVIGHGWIRVWGQMGALVFADLFGGELGALFGGGFRHAGRLRLM